MRRGLAGLLALHACTTAAPEGAGPATLGVPVQDAVVLPVGASARLEAFWYDARGIALTEGQVTWSSDRPDVAQVDGAGRVVAQAPGEARIAGSMDAARVVTVVRTIAAADTVAMVDVFSRVRHQEIHAWEAAAGIGEAECNPTAVARYRGEVLQRAVDELGITRLRIALRSGVESPVDPWPAYLAGRQSYAAWRATWMVATNDNADPFVADPSGFQWGWFDAHVEAIVLPMRRRLAERGERLLVNLNFVDFFLTRGHKAFAQMKDAEEYAELVLAAFQHMQERFGFVPDALELNLEPENTAYDGADMGRALVATRRRLATAGFAPEFIGPSTTRAANALAYHDAMVAVPGAERGLAEFSYHTYTGVSAATRAMIRVRALRDSMRVGMLEHIGAGYDGLYEDLTVAHASSWEQFTLAYCGPRDRPENGGVYYQVNVSDSLAPRVNLTHDARLLRQVFRYARPGATRIGATSSVTSVRPLAFLDGDGQETVVLRVRAPMTVWIRGLTPGRYHVNFSERTGRVGVDGTPIVVAPGGLARVQLPGDVAFTLQRRDGGT